MSPFRIEEPRWLPEAISSQSPERNPRGLQVSQQPLHKRVLEVETAFAVLSKHKEHLGINMLETRSE